MTCINKVVLRTLVENTPEKGHSLNKVLRFFLLISYDGSYLVLQTAQSFGVANKEKAGQVQCPI